MPLPSAMSPGPALSVWPTCAVPVIAGAPVADWFAGLGLDRASDTVVAADQSRPVPAQV